MSQQELKTEFFVEGEEEVCDMSSEETLCSLYLHPLPSICLLSPHPSQVTDQVSGQIRTTEEASSFHLVIPCSTTLTFTIILTFPLLRGQRWLTIIPNFKTLFLNWIFRAYTSAAILFVLSKANLFLSLLPPNPHNDLCLAHPFLFFTEIYPFLSFKPYSVFSSSGDALNKPDYQFKPSFTPCTPSISIQFTVSYVCICQTLTCVAWCSSSPLIIFESFMFRIRHKKSPSYRVIKSRVDNLWREVGRQWWVDDHKGGNVGCRIDIRGHRT